MANFQELNLSQIDQAVSQAVGKHIPVTVSIFDGDSWNISASQFLALSDTYLILSAPMDSSGQAASFAPADRVGINFKQGHHKHVFEATVVESFVHPDQDGQPVEALKVVAPSRMQRIQRRSFQRVDVPAGEIVRVSFWRGGKEVEPVGVTDEDVVWTGAVNNLSAGGFQVACHTYHGPQFEVGDLVGVRLSFGLAEESCFADAQFRHAQMDGEALMLGFQFMGLAHSRHGRAALKLISVKVAELQRLQAKHQRRLEAS
ncbi:MAG: flagellar brake protein [Planctomycetota bacterium]